MIFNFIRQQRKAFPVNKLCEVMGVSRSGFYRYLKERPDKKIMVEFEAISKVRVIHKRMNGKYGSRRMSKQLTANGIKAEKTEEKTYQSKEELRKKDVMEYIEMFIMQSDSIQPTDTKARINLRRKVSLKKLNKVSFLSRPFHFFCSG